jgi:hypothetical protein
MGHTQTVEKEKARKERERKENKEKERKKERKMRKEGAKARLRRQMFVMNIWDKEAREAGVDLPHQSGKSVRKLTEGQYHANGDNVLTKEPIEVLEWVKSMGMEDAKLEEEGKEGAVNIRLFPGQTMLLKVDDEKWSVVGKVEGLKKAARGVGTGKNMAHKVARILWFLDGHQELEGEALEERREKMKEKVAGMTEKEETAEMDKWLAPMRSKAEIVEVSDDGEEGDTEEAQEELEEDVPMEKKETHVEEKEVLTRTRSGRLSASATPKKKKMEKGKQTPVTAKKKKEEKAGKRGSTGKGKGKKQREAAEEKVEEGGGEAKGGEEKKKEKQEGEQLEKKKEEDERQHQKEAVDAIEFGARNMRFCMHSGMEGGKGEAWKRWNVHTEAEAFQKKRRKEEQKEAERKKKGGHGAVLREVSRENQRKLAISQEIGKALRKLKDQKEVGEEATKEDFLRWTEDAKARREEAERLAVKLKEAVREPKRERKGKMINSGRRKWWRDGRRRRKTLRRWRKRSRKYHVTRWWWGIGGCRRSHKEKKRR